ncbi:hypothetical protein AMAG_17824 [Allomyces macrogynus ATCC 38327]|uniref:Uncharacterized protein n=1 Tax=Allomyces macrogynus (strain ATCC 38327) TaxID=578462 RepID=A0A0L0S0C9_ALLM3|nr:hypothetical protein AMAG_17824 [Allomyces macrogynus ATCC 38327]|eukprot:KNE55779.1 hypothetical protein AMAG_17824 [Allomyces macrogynus ATCC 38327]
MSNGQEWKWHRKVVASFRRGWSTHIFEVVGSDLIAELDKLAARNETMNPSDWMHRTALDALWVAAFGDPLHAVSNPDTKLLNIYHDLLRDIFNQVGNVLPITSLLSRRTTLKLIDDFNAFLFSVIDKTSAELAATSSIRVECGRRRRGAQGRAAHRVGAVVAAHRDSGADGPARRHVATVDVSHPSS